ncbi:ethanolamine-phosphate cytidylyltransferase-like isoform X3, partial [Leptotrombidium deliense]
PWTGVFNFSLTASKIFNFLGVNKSKVGDRIAYVCGAFDLFHVGHVDFLEKVRQIANYVIVGVHTDQDVSRYCGGNFPILSLNERILSVLACKYVDDVVIGAPYSVTADIMDQLKKDIVCNAGTLYSTDYNASDPYIVPKHRGKYFEVDCGNYLTTSAVVKRIGSSRLQYIRRNEEKERKEIAAFETIKRN